MSWIYTKFDVEILEALYTISRATDIKDVKKGASMIHAPGLNIMYGDAKGNVAWWAAGQLYKLKPGVNRNFILNGASGDDDVLFFLDKGAIGQPVHIIFFKIAFTVVNNSLNTGLITEPGIF